MEKNDFENFDFQKKINIKIDFFQVNAYLKKNQFSWKKSKKPTFFSNFFFFKMIFLQDEKIFFDGIFFKFI